MNGIIPKIFKRLRCILWSGHEYVKVAQMDYYGVQILECKHCGKTKIV